jgi:hypothetical protein
VPNVKVPERLQELAADLDLDLEDQAEFTSDPAALIAWMKVQNADQRAEENEHRDHIDRELDQLETQMLERTHDA